MNDGARRVSDVERQRAVELLPDDLVAGLLTLEEFSERVEAAYAARVGSELERVRAAFRRRSPDAVRTLRRPSRLTTAVFGHVVRRGRLRLRRRSRVWSMFGDVDVGGLLVFGRRRDWGRDLVRDHAPALRIRARGLFGTVDVWRAPPQMRGDYGEIFRQLREQQRQLPG